jgi:predicted methyltransferase
LQQKFNRIAEDELMKSVRKPFCRSSDGSIAYTTDGSFIYAEKAGETARLDLFDRHYYKLRPWNGVPILEVDGLRMHLVKDFTTPLDYAKEVVKGLGLGAAKPAPGAASAALIRRGQAAVLDTCMGLGYTAIEAAKSPAVGSVTTCEVSPAVITLAKWNPFSEALWEKGGKITVMEGSIAELITQFPGGSFSAVIHDPPRISHAPELYSASFYAELFRVCRKDARIFHYVGSVGKGKGRHIERDAMERLAAAGFRHQAYSARLQGIFASK